MKLSLEHCNVIQKKAKVKEIIASLIDQARDKTSFVDHADPDDIFVLDIRMLLQAALLLQKMQAEPVIVSTARDREYIDYICPRCRDTITQRRKGQKEGLYRPKYHDSCGQRLCWEKLAIKGKVKIKKQGDSK